MQKQQINNWVDEFDGYFQGEQTQNNSQPPVNKSRAAKKRDKIQTKVKRYQTQQAKKQRNKLLRQKIQAKKRSALQGLTKQQAQQHLNKLKQEKQKIRQKMYKGLQSGISILIDCAYQNDMNLKERKSLPMQIQLIYKQMRSVPNPCSLQICGVNLDLKTYMQNIGIHKLPLIINQQDILQVGKKLNKQLIYLSPDAKQQIQQVSNKYAYVIGGLVDRSIIKNASLSRAGQLGIRACRLPITQYMINRKCLNIDHVAMMLVKAQETKDWKTAFYFAAPKRFSKDELQNHKSIEQQQNSSKQQLQKLEDI